jgi:hypothetical protein
MKKIIAISVVFALVTGAAFAQASFGASLETVWTILEGNSEVDGVKTKGGVASSTISTAGSNDASTYGAVLKMEFVGGDGNYDRDINPSEVKFGRAFVWWNPIEQLKFRLGHDGDGQFGTTNLIRWGHFNMPRGISQEGWDQHNYLLGHWDHAGFTASILPVEGFDINLALGIKGGEDLADVLPGRIQVQAGYNVDGVGKFTLTWLKTDFWPTTNTWSLNADDDGGKIGLTFFSNSLADGLAFEVGGNYALNKDNKEALRFAAGVHYSGGDFGIKFRAVAQPREDYFYLLADLMPFYNLGDTVGTFYCNIRVGLTGEDKIAWGLNPYLRNSMGGGHDFRIGLLIDGEGGDKGADGVNFKLATSWVFGF